MYLHEVVKKLNKNTYAKRKKWNEEYLVKERNELYYSSGIPLFGSVSTDMDFTIKDIIATDWELVDRQEEINKIYKKDIDFDFLKQVLNNKKNRLDFTYTYYNYPYTISFDNRYNSGHHLSLFLINDIFVLKIYSSSMRKDSGRQINSNNKEYYTYLQALSNYGLENALDK